MFIITDIAVTKILLVKLLYIFLFLYRDVWIRWVTQEKERVYVDTTTTANARTKSSKTRKV